MAVTVAMEAALGRPFLPIFNAVRIELWNGDVLRLVDFAGKVKIAGVTYVGRHPVYGALGSIEEITDGVESEAPALRLTLLPPTIEAARILCDPRQQTMPVLCGEAIMDKASGTCIDEPDAYFSGWVNIPQYVPATDQISVEFDCVSDFDRFFENDEGIRLSDSWMRTLDINARGLEYVTGVQRALAWGTGGVLPGNGSGTGSRTVGDSQRRSIYF
jgi:hypothetical protein